MSTENSAFNDASFFDEDKEALITKEQKNDTNPDLYRISLDMDTVKNRTYNARGRFVKDINFKGEDGKYVAKVMKKMYYIINPTNTDQKMYVECPSNWKVPTSQNILSSAFFKLRDMDSVTMKRIANNNFGQKQYWWSLFQILIDDQQKDLEGKVKIMRYGKPVNDMIEAASNGQPSLGKEGIDVFNPFKGKDFLLNVFEKQIEDKDAGGGKTKKFPSYEKSSFDDSIQSMMIGGKRVNNDAEGRTIVSEYLVKESPSLSQMASVKWDDAMEQMVIDSMRITIGDDHLLDQILNDCRKGVRRNRVSMSQETKDKLAKQEQEQNTNGESGKLNDQSWNAENGLKKGDESSGSAEASLNDNAASSTDNETGLPEIESEFTQMD